MQTLLKIEGYFISLLFAVITVAVVVQIIFRYFFNFSLAWVEEVALFLFIWFIGVGASATIGNKADIRLSLIVDRFPDKWKYVVEVLSIILCIIMYTVIVKYSWDMAILLIKRQSSTQVVGISLGAFYLGIVTGFILALLTAIWNLYKKVVKNENLFERSF